MSETESTEVTQPGAETEGEPKTFDADYVAKLRAESAKYRTEAKANAGAAARLAEIEEASKSEAQKTAERLAELESEVNGYKTREQVAQWAEEIVKDSPVPASALRGTTREELEAHFEQLKSLIPTPSESAPLGVVGPYVPNEGKSPAGALNGDPLLDALKTKLGIS